MTSTIKELDFSIKATSKHWIEHDASEAIAAMEQTEVWAVDGQVDVEAMLLDFQNKLSNETAENLVQSLSSVCKHVVDFMGFLKSGRALYFFKWISDVDPKMTAFLIEEARSNGSDFGLILIERLRVLDRQRILSRVFSPERIAFVLEIIQDGSEDDDDE